MTTSLREELHLHLYGCLNPVDLWEMGREVYRRRGSALDARLAWFTAEYEKAWGRTPDPAAYFTSDAGQDLLARDFLFTEEAPFARFQACFNLLIALLPLDPHYPDVLRHVARRHCAEGLTYAEYRCNIRPDATDAAVVKLLRDGAQTALELEAEFKGRFIPRLAFSLNRGNKIFVKHLQLLRGVLAAEPDLARAIVAVDCSGVEEGFPPREKRGLFEAIRRVNAKEPATALAILYHVGESFTDKSLASAVRWIFEAHAFGAHRLGHAIALGIAPEKFTLGAARRELVSERRDHLTWLENEASWLTARGVAVDHDAIRAERAKLAGAHGGAYVELLYDEAAAAALRALQDAVMAELAVRGAVIESCPTSNRLIGDVRDLTHHPLKRFMRTGMNVTLSSDDPGIFGTTLAGEETVCRRDLGLTDADVARLAAAATASRSERLAGRPPALRA